MSASELLDFFHVYSMFSFRNGRREPGILINKYNPVTTSIEYLFVAQVYMQAYKKAFDQYDKETCARLSEKIEAEEVLSIRPVSLSDYKIIMQLLEEKAGYWDQPRFT